MKLPVNQRIRVAAELLASADAEGYDDAVNAAWADEVERRSREMRDGSVRGLSIEEARRVVGSDSGDDR
jgi:putative addiction module component (TIGR02574 family)